MGFGRAGTDTEEIFPFRISCVGKIQVNYADRHFRVHGKHVTALCTRYLEGQSDGISTHDKLFSPLFLQ